MQAVVAVKGDAVAREPRDFAVAVIPEPGTKGNPLLDLATTARRLGVSKKTVRRLAYRGILGAPHRVGGKLCLPEASVLAYLRGVRVRVIG